MSSLRHISRVLLCVIMLMMQGWAMSQASAATSQDSTHFVTASLMVISPGSEIYSVFGHCVLHMQCPSKHLDYVYTFETEPNYLKFFAGKSKACFVAVPTQEFLQQYKSEGRGVTEYELNLMPHEKQELWRALDEDMAEGATRRFTMLKSNCVSMSLFMIEQALEKRYIDFTPNNWLPRMGNARILHSYLRHSPWADFLFFTFSGVEADNRWSVEDLLSPTNVGPCLQSDQIVSTDGHQRWPVFVGKPRQLSAARPMSAPSWFTPNVFALLLLLLIVGISIIGHVCRSCCRPSSAAHCFMSRLSPVSSAVAGTGISSPSIHYPLWCGSASAIALYIIRCMPCTHSFSYCSSQSHLSSLVRSMQPIY